MRRRLGAGLRVLSVVPVVLWLVAGLGTAPAQARPRDKAPSFLRISLRSVTPIIVTTGDDSTVKVEGEVENFSDRTVTDVEARLQRAPAVLDSDGLSESLTREEETYDTLGPFQPIADTVPAHGRVHFSLSLPLRGPGDSLDIPAPGIYPLLVNVNGTPDSGTRARLDDLRFLLPVLGLPPVHGQSASPARIDHPTRVGFLLPFADHPRWAAGSIDGDGAARLTDDELADELAPGGRLSVLLAGLEGLIRSDSPAQRQLRHATCVEVDPDLMLTVSAMTMEYAVQGPHGELTPGKGAAAARSWLDRLRADLVGQCVVPLPFAHADLGAVAALADNQFGQLAVSEPADVLDRVLGVTSTRGVAVAGNVKLSQQTVEMLQANDIHTVLAARAAGPAEESRALGSGVTAVQFDSTISAMLGELGAQPDPSLPPGDPFARQQSAMAAVLWPPLRPSNPDQLPSTGGLELLAPPSVWGPSAADFDAFVTGVATLFQTGLAKPVSWTPKPGSNAVNISVSPPVVHAAQAAEPKTLDKPLPNDVADDVAQAWGALGDLGGSLVEQPDDPVPKSAYLKSWQEQLLRVLASGPSCPEAGRRMDAFEGALTAATRSVRLIDPGKPYTFFSEQSSLPLVVRNGLPVSVRVQLVAHAPSGVAVADTGVTVVPPHGSRDLHVPARVKVSRLTPVQIELRSPTGLALGNPVTVSVQSGQYDNALKRVTAVIGGLLLALMGVRLWRRFTGRGGATGRVKPDQRDRRLAGLGWRERTLIESRHETAPPDDD